MTEMFALGTGMISLMKSLDMNQAAIMTVVLCALLVLLFNLVALWRLTSPVRELSNSLKHFTEAFTLKMDAGEKRFKVIESEQQDQNLAIKELKAHVGLK